MEQERIDGTADQTKQDDTFRKAKSSGKIKSIKALKILEGQGYIVGKTLGSGSYASVKSAYDINQKHKVAIKIISKKKSFKVYLTKFLPREIATMRNLGHHYAVIKFYQIIETTTRYFFIMELAENGDLLREIKAKEYIQEDQAGRWFIHLYEGIRYMHGKGLVHRDIKCENLVLDKENTLKITDFGFAKKSGRTRSGGPSLCDTYCGSYAYAAPEILKGIPHDPEITDIWSMGVVLFTMVYGRLPFDDSNLKELLKQVSGRVTFPAKPDVSEKCQILMLKIFTKASDRIILKNFRVDTWFRSHRGVQNVEKNEKNPRGTSVADDKMSDDTKSIQVTTDKKTS